MVLANGQIVDSGIMISKGDIVSMLIESGYMPFVTAGKWDTAVPIEWVDRVEQKIGDRDITKHFIWLYDDIGGIPGRPFPITRRGTEMLSLVSRRV